MSVNVLEDKKTIFHTVRNTYKKKKKHSFKNCPLKWSLYGHGKLVYHLTSYRRY